MPTYEFYCNQCRKKFSQAMSLSAHEKKEYSCPTCGSKDVKPQISSFQTKTSKKS